MIKALNINKSYGSLQVLKDVSISVDRGEIVSIVGASGAGKTTLLQIIGTLDHADSGKVVIDGHDVTSLGERELAAFRNKNIGFVFQSHNLLPEFTALENVCLPALIAGRPMEVARQEALALMRFLAVDQRADHKPAALSGGEQQRVAVARALINKPAVVLADEPSGNLDTARARELHELFFSLRDEYKHTFVIVTHNNELAAMSDRTIALRDGKVETL
ncbi:MAG: ABC transporter ATP-binding protein [Bacteroidales bacterium]|nr:ABC transporter ATP-binding protein [Bacteroidales bacterium]